ncbi:helix-turn-helix domain-containing protein [Lutimonas saemankumensis]|uniref:helix-turn-helix domain-containing protein n=1 Tax=Lutimonas saemankumensis TaxID=483016 RepID=UPI001CD53CEB|nr:helix-turn-helix domain-containing protein [Lutimonas saemankumensis]MCA0932728.1 helix-turn-helix domain-containing protein [Lutimonas saemankumensis]
MAWNMGDLTLQMNDVILNWGFLQVIDSGFFLLYGPIIYIYAQGVIFKDFKLSKTHLLHLIPYLLLTLFLFVAGNPSPKTSAEFISSDLPWQFYLGSILIYLHFYVYMVMTYRSLWKYRQVIKNKYSQIEKINLDWLSFALNTFVLITIISFVHNFIPLANNMTVFLITLILLLIFIFYFVNKVILDALRQPEIFSGINQKETSRYQGSKLTSSQIKEYKERLIELFNTEKTFLDPEVSLKDLSEKLSISSKNLSQVINQSFDKSFFDFINSYRIKEAQHIFKEAKDDKMTVMEVMFDVGFNSKSSFNTAFKKETGQTPTEFRKTI